MILALLLAAMTPPAPPDYPNPPVPRPNLNWLAGYWLRCDHGSEVSETWSDWRAPSMQGFKLVDGSWQRIMIGFSRDGGLSGLSYFWQGSGERDEMEFVLIHAGRRELIFENRRIAYPRRVIYRRVGQRLTWRIEGTGPDGQPTWAEDVYRAAPLNRRCPPSRADPHQGEPE
jgi:hypothetical protein